MTKSEQLKDYFKSKGIKQQEVADTCGFNKSFVSELFSGKRTIGYETADKIVNAFPELNRQWLLTGEGEMLRATGSASDSDEVSALRREVAELRETVERQNRIIDALTAPKSASGEKVESKAS
ncbi:MAG: helix-turn-helix domain-containing protein [Bacteroidales bacterium]|nr:helix-turn-helix domain-containing protein [Bacteroidales bacterium]